jgi:hypothetical protein
MPIPDSVPEPTIPDELLNRGVETLHELVCKAYRLGHRDGWKVGWRAGLAQYIRPKKQKRNHQPPVPRTQVPSAEAEAALP